MTQELLDRLRDFALSLPETSEVPSWGHPNFRAGKRTFAVYEIYHGRPCIAVKLPRPDGEALLTDPRFFSTPYIGKQGWVSLWVDRPVKWGFVKDLVLRSYREVATPGMLKALAGAGKKPARSKRSTTRGAQKTSGARARRKTSVRRR